MNKIKEAIGLLCSMIDGREQHSATSRLLAIEALEENTRLLRIEEAAKRELKELCAYCVNFSEVSPGTNGDAYECQRTCPVHDTILALKEG